MESEVQRLRSQIPDLMKRVEKAEEASRRAEDEAAALRGDAPSSNGETSSGGETSNGGTSADDVSPGVAAWR